MKKDVIDYVSTCNTCQLVKAYLRPRGDRMVVEVDGAKAMEVVHLDFAELEKKGEGRAKTKAFLVAVDRNTRYAAAQAGKESAETIIKLLEQDLFKSVKVIRSDRARVFESKRLKEWASSRGITLRVGTPYHPESNGLAERLIKDLKIYLKLYPAFPGGWKAALEAAVRHHNRSHVSTIGCSPRYALTGEPTTLPADDILRIHKNVLRDEKRKSPEEERNARNKQKEGFDSRRSAKVQNVRQGDWVLVHRGVRGDKKPFTGPYKVTAVTTFNGETKRVYYEARGKTEVATIGKIVRFRTRRS